MTARSNFSLKWKSGRLHANWLSKLVIMTGGRKWLFRVSTLFEPTARACLDCPGVDLTTTAQRLLRKALTAMTGFALILQIGHIGSSCNVGSFGTRCWDKPALVGGVAGVSFIKKPLEYGFRYSVRLLAFAVTVCRLSELDRKQHACVESKYIKHAILFFRLKPY